MPRKSDGGRRKLQNFNQIVRLKFPEFVVPVRVMGSKGGGFGTEGMTPRLDLSGPSVEGTGYLTFFLIGGDPAKVAADAATITDPSNGGIETMTIVVTGAENGNDDILAIDSTDFALATNNTDTGLTGGGTTFTAAYTAGVNGGTFVITKTGGGNAPVSDVVTLILGMRYREDNASPVGGARTLDFTINNGTENSPVASCTMEIAQI